MSKVYFSIGTNLGNRQQNIETALVALSGLVDITYTSSVYETTPWGPIANQPDFYNICVAGTTYLRPQKLLVALKHLETRLGRRHTDQRWGPHLIDIDLLFYDNVVMSYGASVIPHRQIEDRAFVLIPLNEIAPDVVHPVTGRSVAEMATEVSAEGIIRLDQFVKPPAGVLAFV